MVATNVSVGKTGIIVCQAQSMNLDNPWIVHRLSMDPLFERAIHGLHPRIKQEILGLSRKFMDCPQSRNVCMLGLDNSQYEHILIRKG